MSKTIFCFIPGTKNIFPIDYDERTTVGHLKKEIHQQNLNMLRHIDAKDLTLYKISIGFSNLDHYRMILDRVTQGIFTFDPPKQELLPSLLVSTIFQEPSNQGMISILVEPPEGESIYCGGVPVATPSLWLMVSVPPANWGLACGQQPHMVASFRVANPSSIPTTFSS